MDTIKERPIIFTGESVAGILNRTKTMTRRVVKFPLHRTWDTQIDMHQEVASVNRDGGGNWIAWSPTQMTDEQTARLYPNANGFPCPHGRPGDRLWVRETWATVNSYDHLKPSDIPKGDRNWPMVWYDSHPTAAASITANKNSNYRFLGKTRSPLFMPRWASRITLEVTAVRVERLQEIRANRNNL